MSDQIQVSSPVELLRLADAIGSIDHAVGRHSRAARETIAHRFRSIERRGRELEEVVDEARRALESLDGDDDGAEERERYAEAARNLRRFNEVARECVAIKRGFEAELASLIERSSTLCARASREMAAKARDAAAYQAIRIDGASAGGPGAVQIARNGSPALSVNDALTALGQAKAAASREGLPPGFVWIDLTLLSDSSFVADPAEFKKGIPKERMQRGIELLERELLPALKADPTLGRSHFDRLDRERGTSHTATGFVHPESLTVVWDAFFETRDKDMIRINNVAADGRLEAGNGRHRLGVAREMGLRFVPGWIQP